MRNAEHITDTVLARVYLARTLTADAQITSPVYTRGNASYSPRRSRIALLYDRLRAPGEFRGDACCCTCTLHANPAHTPALFSLSSVDSRSLARRATCKTARRLSIDRDPARRDVSAREIRRTARSARSLSTVFESFPWQSRVVEERVFSQVAD